MKLDFEWHEAHGTVQIDCRVNDDPDGLGCVRGALGLPACNATFDGPSRSSRDDLESEAHSFLATTPLEEVTALQPRRVVPLVGFWWDFDICIGHTEIRPVRPLSLEQWNAQTSVLLATYPLWSFAEA